MPHCTALESYQDESTSTTVTMDRAFLGSALLLGCAWRLSHHVSTWAALRGVRGADVGAAVNFDAPPLPDVLHELFPEVDFRATALHPDLFPGLLSLATALLVVLRCPRPGALALEYAGAATQLLLMRTLCVAVTTLPSPTPQCRTRAPAQPEVRNPFYYCNDTIFSGHTAANVLTALVWRHGGGGPRAPPRAAAAAALAVACLGSLQLVITRYHYTIDTVVGAMITFWFVEARKRAWVACWADDQQQQQQQQRRQQQPQQQQHGAGAAQAQRPASMRNKED